jgi:hypothetical protein
MNENNDWFRNRGYVHLSGQANLSKSNAGKLRRRIESPSYVQSHAFFPLLHVVQKQRRYKICPNGKRAHSFWNGYKKQLNLKPRPLHYATHVDAMIYGYYAQMLRDKYEDFLRIHPELDAAVTAYRSIPTKENPGKNKSNIHHAKEVFEIVSIRGEDSKVVVLTFDIKSFFSQLDHKQLYTRWAKILGYTKLPPDHLNVFRSCTRFSYVLKDELRTRDFKFNIRRSHFDEKKLAKIRNTVGTHSFFFDAKDFRKALKNKEFQIHKNHFKNGEGEMIGIPQGLPVSAVLANIYLMDFDLAILDFLRPLNVIYRRYSDDIVVVCQEEQIGAIKAFIDEQIKLSRLCISQEKTEVFYFEKEIFNGQKVLISSKIIEGKVRRNIPLTYLGFEFYGYQTLIKSANLSKFYRKMIFGVKAKCRIANRIAEKEQLEKPIVFLNQLRRFYNSSKLNETDIYRNRSITRFKKLPTGEFRLVSKPSSKKTSTYFSYVARASLIMNEPKIVGQIRNHQKIFHQALSKGLNKRKK